MLTIFSSTRAFAIDMGVLEKLNPFLSRHGAAFYGLPPNKGAGVQLERKAWTVPAELQLGSDTVVPLRAGESIEWSMIHK